MCRSRVLWGTLVLMLVFGLGGCIPIPIGLSPTPTIPPPPVGSRRIAESSLSLREYWRMPFAFMGGSMVATPDQVVYTDYVSGVPHVRVLDAATGDLLWEVVGKHGSAILAMDAERVYVEDAYNELHVYDVEDGQQLWTRRFTPHRSRSYDPDEGKLYIWQGGSGEDYIYTLDARTGDILNTESRWTSDHFLVAGRFPQFDLHIYTVQTPRKLRAVDPATQQTLWQLEHSPGLSLFLRGAVLVDDVLLLGTDGEVVALDALSGQIRWRTPDPARSSETLFVTWAVTGDSLYALRWDACLVQLDPRTGQEIGYIRFTPPLSDSNAYGGANSPGLVIDGEMLFVSFDDSQELIVLGP